MFHDIFYYLFHLNRGNSEESSSNSFLFLRVFSPQVHCHGSFIFIAIGNIVNIVLGFKKSRFRVFVKTVNYWGFAPLLYATCCYLDGS